MDIEQLIVTAEQKCSKIFDKIDDIALFNQKKVLNAFRDNRISETHFTPTTGYGYGDSGKDKLCALFAQIFGTEDAIVSPLISSGTHAISLCLHGTLRPGNKVLSLTDVPYDTIHKSIWGDNCGSLKEYNIDFDIVPLSDGGTMDINSITAQLKSSKYDMIYVQRSRGYEWRNPLSISEMQDIFQSVKTLSPHSIIMVDNCYGEFVDRLEPTDIGADLIAGSLIKNPGGGIAPTGGYICGSKSLLEKISYKLTAPGVGTEVGSYAYGYREYFQGLFLAPHTTAQALKGAVLFATAFEQLGYTVLPKTGNYPYDIISSIKFEVEEELIKFCRSIQYASPIDSFVTPYPWDMPGYDNQVIMAAGAFIQGSSIELSCDGPIRSPYIAYVQGGLTYEHIKLALAESIATLLSDK